MEFLRFGSSIPGSYWGCCAVCIIQNFKMDPDHAASIELVCGDSGSPTGYFAGMTYKEVFETQLRVGTFGAGDMPNHGFFAVLTHSQIVGFYGSKWLAILKASGFEFIRTVDNSVYTGPSLTAHCAPHPNYIFGLFRNISASKIQDPFTPPKEWTALPDVVPESWSLVAPNDRMTFGIESSKAQKALWLTGKTKKYKREDVEAKGVSVTLAGQRSKYPQQLAAAREKNKPVKAKVDAFAASDA